MLKVTGLGMERALDPLLGLDQPVRSISIAIKMRGLEICIQFLQSR